MKLKMVKDIDRKLYSKNFSLKMIEKQLSFLFVDCAFVLIYYRDIAFYFNKLNLEEWNSQIFSLENLISAIFFASEKKGGVKK